ncbi:hypothetical protein [Stratiformator vulcanicus]|uniref:DUF155 domain-containing protein n=1 Tax=Stratiformator vulcanicus TaxID=2527980 RepID=A0A517R5Y1_9PLAN|nr:hypothetical protein [Stratiformator vulcanicus]QDT39281.1 hypothetical protein Pan189_36860 [Stratiformator vulcanicus]
MDERTISSPQQPLRSDFQSEAFPDASVESILIVNQLNESDTVIHQFEPPLQLWAVRQNETQSNHSRVEAEFDFLFLPTDATDRKLGSTDVPGDVATEMQQWTQQSSGSHTPTPYFFNFQGTQVSWSIDRCAVHAPIDKVDTIRRTIAEVSYYELEMRRIESELGSEWPQLEADIPLAFDFNESSLETKNALLKRFQFTYLTRARLARLGPFIHSPHLYPPTLASQLNERLRDRTRITYRHEFVSDQLEVFEEVYELCGQRSSDYSQARTGHILEWIIIIILIVQVLFSVAEILAGASST